MILKMKVFKEELIIILILKKMKILILNYYSKGKTKPIFNNDLMRHCFDIFYNSNNLIF